MAEKCKLTILPTKNWLILLSILDTESTNKLLLADLIDEGKQININQFFNIYFFEKVPSFINFSILLYSILSGAIL